MQVPEKHFVNGNRIVRAVSRRACSSAVVRPGLLLGRGEAVLEHPGVYSTAVGYAGGETQEPDLRGSLLGLHRTTPRRCWWCSTRRRSSYETLLKAFWEEPRPDAGHAPGQRRRARSTARRSTRTATRSCRNGAVRQRSLQQELARRKAIGTITTEIRAAPEFYYAEDCHQQYLGKNPDGLAARLGRHRRVLPDRSRRRPPEDAGATNTHECGLDVVVVGRALFKTRENLARQAVAAGA